MISLSAVAIVQEEEEETARDSAEAATESMEEIGCLECSKRFRSKHLLIKHALDSHVPDSTVPAFKCKKCDKVYRHARDLKTHQVCIKVVSKLRCVGHYCCSTAVSGEALFRRPRPVLIVPSLWQVLRDGPHQDTHLACPPLQVKMFLGAYVILVLCSHSISVDFATAS